MSKVPKSVKVYFESSKSALEDSDTLRGAYKYNATRYFLLISAWELYELADSELDAWVWKKPKESKVYKDHSHKLTKSPTIRHIEVRKGKAIETEYTTAGAKSKIRQWTIFGMNNKSRTEIFWQGWHFDTFRSNLVGKIKLFEVTIEAMELLDNRH